MAQVVEHLPSKCKGLNSNPSTTTKKKKRMGLGCSSVVQHLPSMCEALYSIPTPKKEKKQKSKDKEMINV
jgi:hypothetical protein